MRRAVTTMSTLAQTAPTGPRLAHRLDRFGALTVWQEFSPLAAQTGAVNLGQGFPNWATPAFVKDAMNRAVAEDHNQYCRSAGHTPLVNAVAKRCAEGPATLGLGDPARPQTTRPAAASQSPVLARVLRLPPCAATRGSSVGPSTRRRRSRSALARPSASTRLCRCGQSAATLRHSRLIPRDHRPSAPPQHPCIGCLDIRALPRLAPAARALQTFVNPGDEVILISPAFDIYIAQVGAVASGGRRGPMRDSSTAAVYRWPQAGEALANATKPRRSSAASLFSFTLPSVGANGGRRAALRPAAAGAGRRQPGRAG
jgi:hypothetical protein